MAPAGAPPGVRRIHPGPEIAMNPRNLPTASASMPPAMRGDANAVGRTTPVYHPQVHSDPPVPMIDMFMHGENVMYVLLEHRLGLSRMAAFQDDIRLSRSQHFSRLLFILKIKRAL